MQALVQALELVQVQAQVLEQGREPEMEQVLVLAACWKQALAQVLVRALVQAQAWGPALAPRAGMGAGAGTGAGAGLGTGVGASSGTGAGAGTGAGTGATEGAGPGAGAKSGVEAGAGTCAGTGAGTGAGARSGPGTGAGTGAGAARERALGAEQAPALEQILALGQALEQTPVQGVCSRSTPCLASGLEQARCMPAPCTPALTLQRLVLHPGSTYTKSVPSREQVH